MSLLSSTETYTGTSVSRMFPDDVVPDPFLRGVMSASLNNRDLSASIQNEVFNGAWRNFERYYHYGRTKYIYGLPNFKFGNSNVATDAVEAVLNTLYPTIASIGYVYYSTLNNVHMGWISAVETYGYASETNELTVLSAQVGYPVYLDDIVPIFVSDPNVYTGEVQEGEEMPGRYSGFRDRNSDNYSPSSGGTPLRPVNRDNPELQDLVLYRTPFELGAELGVRIKYVWQHPDTQEITEDSIVISLASYDVSTPYYHAKFTLADDSVVYWLYDPATEVHPTLTSADTSDSNTENDPIFTTTSEDNYFPIVLFRSEGESLSGSAALSTRKLMSQLGIEFDSFSDSFDGQEGLENVSQAAVMFAVAATGETQTELAYLFAYYKKLHAAFIEAGLDNKDSVKLVKFQQLDFRYQLGFLSTQARILVGNSHPIGTYFSSQTTVQLTSDFRFTQDEIEELGIIYPNNVRRTANVEEDPDTGILSFDTYKGGLLNAPVHYVCKQVTANTYERVAIYGLAGRFYPLNSAKKSILVTPGDDRLLIPLDYDICKELGILGKQELYYASAHLVFNHVIEQEVEWYESGFFRAILQFVAIVVFIYSMGTTWQGVVAAFAEAGLTGAALVILESVLLSYVISQGLQFVIEALGLEESIFGALVLVTISLIISRTGIGAGTIGTSEMTWADALLKLGSGMLTQSGNYAKELTAGVGKELEALAEEREDAYNEMGNKRESLGLEAGIDIDLDLFIRLEPYTVIGEESEAFFDRLIHTGNIGTVGFEYIEKFVDTSLTLPTIDSTLRTGI